MPRPSSSPRRTPCRSFVRLFGLLALLLLLAAPEAPAQGREYRLERFHATLRVHEDATLEVLERLRFRFDGAFEGVYRTIPTRYPTPLGFDHRLFLDVESVTDESGAELRWEESRDGDDRRIKIWVPDAVDASRTVTIRYSVVGGIRFFDDDSDAEGFPGAHDELYWNVTGTEWEVPIDLATARVELPPGTTGRRATVYTGPFGSRESRATTQEIEEGFQFATDGRLGPGEGLTVVVGWEPGVVDRPGALRRAGLFVRSNWILLLPLLLAGGVGWLWREKGRDPPLRSVAPRYHAPDGLAPAEIGTLVDHRPDTRDVTATLVDLAVRGYVRIEEIDQHLLQRVLTGQDYRFHLLRGASEWKELREHERELLQGIFGAGGTADTVVELSDLKNDFYEHLDDIRDGIFGRLVDLGFYRRRPDRVRAAFMVAGAAVVALLFLALHFGGVLATVSPVSVGVAAAGSLVPVLGFGYFMPARTRKGARALEEVLGFEEFLDRVEEDRFRRMIRSPEDFEKYLPHAIALGVDATWARAFRDLVQEPPEWYVGSSPGGFRTTSFTESLGRLSARTGAVFASRPRGSSSSGSSGFSGGGGSSGGGFGGGGGGAF